MKEEGLLIKPEFENIEKYLNNGEMTSITKRIIDVTKNINGETDGIIVRKILLWMNQNTMRLRNGQRDSRKFRRTADEILLSRERNGCCDSATLFTALARSKQIPTMQIITLKKSWGEKIDKGIPTGTEGHYFVACYLKDVTGKSKWTLIDSDRQVTDIRDVRLRNLNTEDRNIDGYYAFAYVNDFRNISINGRKIDSIENMKIIQEEAYKECDKKDFKEEIER